MKKTQRNLLVGIFIIIAVAFMAGVAISDKPIVVTGTVNAFEQIVDDNEQAYEIGDTEKGMELSELIDAKVRVTGTVLENDDEKVIMVISYEVIEKE
jgi:hypothetical protein